MRKKILAESVRLIAEDTKLIRLATITTFIHSLLFIIYLLYLLMTFRNAISGESNNIKGVLNDFLTIFEVNTTLFIVLALLIVFLLIGYALLPPIGDAAMISYLDKGQKSGSASIGVGLSKFFPMFEFNATLQVFNMATRCIAFSRMRMLGIHSNFMSISLMSMWAISIFAVLVLLPYTKFIITAEDEDYFTAMGKSMKLSIQNLGITIKFVLINLLLYLRFLFNILTVVGIPLGLIYLANRRNIIDSSVFQTVIVLLIVGLVALTAYINGIIEAFFITYRWKVWKKIQEEE